MSDRYSYLGSGEVMRILKAVAKAAQDALEVDVHIVSVHERKRRRSSRLGSGFTRVPAVVIGKYVYHVHIIKNARTRTSLERDAMMLSRGHIFYVSGEIFAAKSNALAKICGNRKRRVVTIRPANPAKSQTDFSIFRGFSKIR